MFFYVALVLWQYGKNDPWPLIRLPDWAVHYMARYFYADETTGDPELIEHISSLAQEEWELRHNERKAKRLIKN